MHLNGEAYLPGTEASGKTVRIEAPAPGVRLLTLDRPDRLNAMSGELIRDLHRALDQVAADDECRVVVLTGAGRGFCAGLDLKERPSHQPGAVQISPQSRMHVQQAIAALVPKLRNLRQPVIAAVNGPCVGAGLALSLAADIRICSTAATFGNAAILLGLSGAEMGMSYFLPRIVGASVAADWMLTGRIVSAEEADRRGLVSELVEPPLLVERALEIASGIAELAPLGVQLTKRAIQVNTDAAGLESALELENRNQVLSHATEEAAARRQTWSSTSK